VHMGGARRALLTNEVMVEVRATREPNRLLAAVMQEAEISNKGLALRVRAEAEKAGLAISPDHVSVRRWLSGVRPHDDAIRCIAAALGAKLGRKITFPEIGFDPAPIGEARAIDDAAHYPPTSAQAVELLSELAAADLADSPSLIKSLWVPDAAPGIITEYLFGEPWRADFGSLAGYSGTNIAERIRATVQYLMDLDFQFGGGHTRKMLLFYWKTEIAPALREQHPDLIRREVFSAAANAAEMLGWSAYDSGRHGAGQRYFTQGLRLAREADDQVIGSRILSSMSHQANYLGRFSEAIQFARSAQASGAGKVTQTVNAMFLAMEARALASIGDGRACAEILHRAELEFDRGKLGEDPAWIKYFDGLELAGEAAHCFRDLGKHRETLQFVTQALDPVLTPPRTRAFIGLVSAAGSLAAGDVDQAVATASEAIGHAGALKSSRYLRYVEDFHNSLVSFGATGSAVRSFTDLLVTTYPALSFTALPPIKTGANRSKAPREESASALDIPQQSRSTRQHSA
jgi:hypothetical protein